MAKGPCHRWPTNPSQCHSVEWTSLTPQQRVSFAHKNGTKYDPALMAWDQGIASGNWGGAQPSSGQPQTYQPPAASAAAAPPPPVWAPDSGYNDAMAIAKRRYEATTGDLDTAERTTKFEFGFDDPTNPFSRANEMKKQHLQRGMAITGGLASRGHLYSGVHQARLDVNRRNEEKNFAALRAAYQARLDEIRTRRTGAQTSREEEELRARIESMARQGVN